MNPISNERSVSPLGNIGNVAGLQPAAEPRSETRLDAAVTQASGATRTAGVALTPPLAASNDRPGQKVLAEISRLVRETVENSGKLLPRVGALVTAAFTSPAAFEIELGKLTSDLERTQTKLKLDDIRRARELNDKKIGENQEKIKEACILSVDLEFAFIDRVFEMGNLKNLTKEQLQNFIKARANEKMVELGYKKIYEVDETLLDEMAWFGQITSGVEHQDFFAQKPSAYSKSTADWSDL